MKRFGDALRDRADELGISGREVARRCGLEYGRYGNYVSNKREPDLATLCKIAWVLGTSPNYLLGFDQNAGLPADAARLLSAFALLDEDGRRLATALVETLAEQLTQTPPQGSPSPPPLCIEGTAPRK
jgi:transcriptional regulator with XRE-family HTH domain